MLRPYIASLVVGIVVGAFYALLGVRSPAPPLIALLGLFGFLVGENGFPLLKEKLALGDTVKKRPTSLRTQVKKACTWSDHNSNHKEAA